MRYGGVSRLNTVRLFKIYPLQKRFFTQTPHLAASTEIGVEDVSKIRNVGIIAHIDAGKTTTTERMLYYSGHTRRIGNVDEGSTVTDFLPAERARGITIQSAAITFYWPPQNENFNEAQNVKELPHLRSKLPHQINLIDTPGHADFTFEVRRSLRVLDGAICVLDGVAGVEAQTEQVWNQAAEWKIPRIVYVNKLDRDGAAFGRTVREIGLRLNGWPAVCHVPWFEGGKGRFCGIADVLNLHCLFYEEGDGKIIRTFTLQELEAKEPSLVEELRKARVALVELLSEYDDKLVEAFLLANENHLALTQSQLIESLRRCLLLESCNIIPVFAGASFRNIGVQPLLDAVNHLLPSPQERPEAEISIGEKTTDLATLLRGDSNLHIERIRPKNQGGSLAMTATLAALKGCALAFKVVNEARRGILVYIRVYSGSIDRNTILYNTNTKTSERVSTLLRMYANESVPIQSIEAGQIGVIAGSKFARTGDTLIAYGNKGTPPQPLDKLQLRPIHVPPPVFFASLEPNSLKDEKDMHEKLNLLLREDPSLHVTQDEDTGQTLISGMGELHLEIARDRLVNDLRANATMGKIAIGYRETLTEQSESVTKFFDSSSRGDTKGKAGCSAFIQPLSPSLLEALDQEDGSLFKHSVDGNTVIVQTLGLDDQGRSIDEVASDLPSHLTLHEIQQAYVNGALAALARGPLYSYPMHNVLVTLTLDPSSHIFGGETSYSSLTAAARLATIASFRTASSSGSVALMEPVMNVDINVDDASLGTVVHDISSSRGGQILSLGDNEEADAGTISVTEIDPAKIYTPKDPFESGTSSPGFGQQVNKQRSIKAKVPLKEMVGYLKHLRSMTGGRGTFTMSVDRFERMTGQREKALLAELQGGM